MTPGRALAWSAVALGAAVTAACGDGRLEAFVPTEPPGASGGSGGSPSGGAAAAGLSGTAGSAGAAGTGTWDGVIDDFEDGDTRPVGGDGWWYAQGDDGRDPMWAIEPTPGPSGASTLALHASGAGYAMWGAQVGVDLPGPNLDASAFSEFRFWLRAAADSTRSLSVQTPDANGKLAYAIEVTPAWREYVIPFRAFAPTDGANRALDPSDFTYIQFFVLSSERFDYWLDDLSFR